MPSVLVTGANRGLGLEFARQYLGDGWQVYAACRNPESASDLRGLCPLKRTFVSALSMSALCQKRTSPISYHVGLSAMTNIIRTRGRRAHI
jgi:NAD(P)-dependent dehydrogenase (short-subunit alcohol dehydrogenase family)